MAYDEQTAKLVRENEQLKVSLRELRDTLKTLLDTNAESWIVTLHKVQAAEVLLGIDSDTAVEGKEKGGFHDSATIKT